jgi:hypothetical protein
MPQDLLDLLAADKSTKVKLAFQKELHWLLTLSQISPRLRLDDEECYRQKPLSGMGTEGADRD